MKKVGINLNHFSLFRESLKDDIHEGTKSGIGQDTAKGKTPPIKLGQRPWNYKIKCRDAISP